MGFSSMSFGVAAGTPQCAETGEERHLLALTGFNDYYKLPSWIC
jgi:hypothetical protein